jgi:hypothetical protein
MKNFKGEYLFELISIPEWAMGKYFKYIMFYTFTSMNNIKHY